MMSSLFSGLYSTLLLRLDHRQLVMRGLGNYCLSCCVNTLLQTLSATWELAEILEKCEATGLGADVHNVPFQLKSVLKAMQKDLPQPAPHKDFLHCLDRNSIRLKTQHDADEVFLSILDLLQLQMNDRTLALEIQGLYKISLETQLQCLECSTIQTQNSHLLSLPLHIREEQNTLEDCMNSFFEQQELGELTAVFVRNVEPKHNPNSYCKHLKATDATELHNQLLDDYFFTPCQGVKVRSLPPILCIQLKRFRNMHGYTMKLNCRVTFPETFNFSEIKKDAFSADFTQNDCRYTLYAVVVHSGSAICGHYTAYVRHRVSKRWYYADDSHVSQSSWEEVQKTYEGRSSATAYMLMYRRDRKEDGQQQDLSG